MRSQKRLMLCIAKAEHARQEEVVVPLAAKHVERGEACVSKNKPRDESNLKREEKLDSVDVAASL